MSPSLVERGLRLAGLVAVGLSAVTLLVGVVSLLTTRPQWLAFPVSVSGALSGAFVLGFAEVLARLRRLAPDEEAPPSAARGAHRAPPTGPGRFFRRIAPPG